MAQLVMFHALAIQFYLRDRASRVTDMAVAFHAKQNDRNSYITKLEKTGSRKKR